jgi:O-glycosyl hydrolase
MKKTIFCVALFLILAFGAAAEARRDQRGPDENAAGVTIDVGRTYQTIAGFAASDCWTTNYVGQYWEAPQKEEIAKWLFSRGTKDNGSPEGIGLSMWRVNLGAGTLEQGGDSDIADISRRAESTLDAGGNYDWSKQIGQQWFLRKAQSYGVENFVAFSNAPLVNFSRNGKGWSNGDGRANLAEDKYDAFAGYLADVLAHSRSEGLSFQYVSPVNEPQYDWKDPTQEGSPWTNAEIRRLLGELDRAIGERSLDTKILITEAGDWKYLYEERGRASNQMYQFFDPAAASDAAEGQTYAGDLPSVPKIIGAHSYWTHDTNEELREVRVRVWEAAQKYGLEVFQTEWSMLSAGEGFPGFEEASYMDIALFMAKVIHSDMAYANASSWSYWTSMDMERWGHKDRFLLVGLRPGNPPDPYASITESGAVKDHPTLWALGNYSLFVRPGFRRVDLKGADDLSGLMGTAYLSPDSQRLVAVYVNMGSEAASFRTAFANAKSAPKNAALYITGEGRSLQKSDAIVPGGSFFVVPPRSVATVVYDF